MKCRILFLSILFVCILDIGISQKSIEFKITKENSQKRNIKSVLLAGVGNTDARIFSDNLSNVLIKDLKDKNVVAVYEFLGSDLKTANTELNHLDTSQQFDVIIVINQSDTTVSDRISNTSRYSFPTSPEMRNSPMVWSNTTTSKLLFDQEFKFRLLEKNKSAFSWEAILNVYFDLSKKSVYSTISDKIIDSFKQNRFFW